MALVRYFAAAAQAAGRAEESVDAVTLGPLVETLVHRHGHGLATVLERCSLLLDGEYVEDEATPVPTTGVLDVLPPFAGG